MNAFSSQIQGGARRLHVLIELIALIGAAIAPSAAHAESADRDKPLIIQSADQVTYNDLKQVIIATGHVVATKGTIIIKADHVTVKQDPQGYQHATATMDGHQLAYFREKRDGADEYIEGNAERLDYDGKNDLTTLTTRAVVRRLQGLSTVTAEVHGSVITYDGQNDFYTARAGQDNAAPGNPTGRVRAMLAPAGGSASPDTSSPTSLTPASSLQGIAPQ